MIDDHQNMDELHQKMFLEEKLQVAKRNFHGNSQFFQKNPVSYTFHVKESKKSFVIDQNYLFFEKYHKPINSASKSFFLKPSQSIFKSKFTTNKKKLREKFEELMPYSIHTHN